MMNSTAQPPPRNAALDNLRVVAMLLGLVTHGVLPYCATGLAGFPIRDRTRHVLADACFFAVHDFRMQLFFLLAGFAAAALGTRRGVGAMVRNRLCRVALPLILAVLVICPLMHLLFAHHAAGRGESWDAADGGGWVGPNFHLWFLYYLLMCAAPLALLLAVSHRIPARVVRAFDLRVRRLLLWRWKIPAAALIGIPLLWNMSTWWIDTPKGWVPYLAVLAYYLAFFFTGALLYRHADLLAGVGRRWLLYFVAGNLLLLPVMVRLTVTGNWAEFEGNVPPWFGLWKAGAIFLGGLYTWMMIAALVGFFQRHFATSTGWWKYLADSSYWCYLAGFPVQAAFQAWLAPYGIPILPEFLLVNVLTFTVLLVTYELCVRHSWIGLMLNGKRPERKPKLEAEPVVIAARVALPETEAKASAQRDERPTPSRTAREKADAA